VRHWAVREMDRTDGRVSKKASKRAREREREGEGERKKERDRERDRERQRETEREPCVWWADWPGARTHTTVPAGRKGLLRRLRLRFTTHMRGIARAQSPYRYGSFKTVTQVETVPLTRHGRPSSLAARPPHAGAMGSPRRAQLRPRPSHLSHLRWVRGSFHGQTNMVSDPRETRDRDVQKRPLRDMTPLQDVTRQVLEALGRMCGMCSDSGALHRASHPSQASDRRRKAKQPTRNSGRVMDMRVSRTAPAATVLGLNCERGCCGARREV
jgi:hypothetical protein